MDPLGTAKGVMISEVSSFQGSFVLNSIYIVAGTINSVLNREVSFFQGYRVVPLSN